MITENLEKKKYCVYSHTLITDGRKYIGITCQKPEYRWKNGEGYCTSNYHNRFYNAIKKYGWDSFEHKILFDNLSQEEAVRIEIDLIEKYKTREKKHGFNTLIGGDLGTAGIKQSQETIDKRRKKTTGKKRTEETKRKISEWHKNAPQEYRDALSKAAKGRIVSDETKAKISQATKEALKKADVKEKIIQANKRRKTSQDTKRIYNVDTNRYYANRKTACEMLGLSFKCLTKCLNGHQKTCGGFEWRWAD